MMIDRVISNHCEKILPWYHPEHQQCHMQCLELWYEIQTN